MLGLVLHILQHYCAWLNQMVRKSLAGVKGKRAAGMWFPLVAASANGADILRIIIKVKILNTTDGL